MIYFVSLSEASCVRCRLRIHMFLLRTLHARTSLFLINLYSDYEKMFRVKATGLFSDCVIVLLLISLLLLIIFQSGLPEKSQSSWHLKNVNGGLVFIVSQAGALIRSVQMYRQAALLC